MKKYLLVTLFILTSCGLEKSIEFEGKSMYPTIDRGEKVIYTNNLGEIERGSIVLFDTESVTPPRTIKRVIGLGGDSIKISNGEVFIKIKGNKDYTVLEESYILPSNPNHNMTFVKGSEKEEIYNIPESHFFLLGDNRNASSDSRTCFLTCSKGRSPYIEKSAIIGIVNK